jgi:hypothetical protein
MSEQNVTGFFRMLGDRPDLLDALKTQDKEQVIAAAADLGFPFAAAEFERLVWDLEARLAETRGEAFDGHFPLWQAMWGHYYLETLVVDLLPSLLETRLLDISAAPETRGSR